MDVLGCGFLRKIGVGGWDWGMGRNGRFLIFGV
jgi:hypothetical protein